MNDETEQQEFFLPLLEKKVAKANAAQLDACWAILKYKEIGILRKLEAYAELFGLKSQKLVDEAPQSDDGRILDKKTRHAIHDFLLARSQELNAR